MKSKAAPPQARRLGAFAPSRAPITSFFLRVSAPPRETDKQAA